MKAQQRTFLVAVISLFAVLTSVSGGLDGTSTGAGVEDAPLFVAACEVDCDDDMHW